MNSILPESSDVQRLECRIYTFAGWVAGTLLLAQSALLLEFLNRGDAVLRLADAQIPGHDRRHPIFILERTAVIALLPEVPMAEIERGFTSSRASIEHHVSWLLPGGGVIEGGLDMLEGMNMADFLAHRTKFVGLRNCTIFLPDGSGGTTIEPCVPWVALQTNRAVGASELC
jgi:hypothetical protein